MVVVIAAAVVVVIGFGLGWLYGSRKTWQAFSVFRRNSLATLAQHWSFRMTVTAPAT
jgi:hypothetical protein